MDKKVSFVSFLLMTVACGLLVIANYGYRKEIKELNSKIYEQNEQIVQLEDYANNQLVVVRYATEEEQKAYEQEIIDMLAKVVWGEARGCNDTQKAAVVWCILNRVDSDKFPNDIASVVTQKGQFDGWNENNPVDDKVVNVVMDVLWRYDYEKSGIDVGYSGRVLPKEYLFFGANSGVNVYRTGYTTKDYWDWSWGTVYKS